MDAFEKEQFWEGLTRLYNATVKLEEATSNLLETATKHESRLDKLEVVQQWLAEKERNREKGQQ